ncbi:MAG: winged helix-turn-helix transcriptional regulator [Methanosarcinales archaeon]|jgi:predicted transcriptional regulator|nr:winged helix-turn-helix transcriptional regulator [Methanosarcinales archaeon]
MLFDQARNELELIDRHTQVLKIVIENGPIGILKLSEFTGMQAHKVRYSLRILEQNGLIKASPQGAVAGDSVDAFLRTANANFRELKNLLDMIEKHGDEIIR